MGFRSGTEAKIPLGAQARPSREGKAIVRGHKHLADPGEGVERLSTATIAPLFCYLAPPCLYDIIHPEFTMEEHLAT